MSAYKYDSIYVTFKKGKTIGTEKDQWWPGVDKDGVGGAVICKGVQGDLRADATLLCVDHGGSYQIYAFIKLVKLYIRNGKFYVSKICLSFFKIGKR